MTTACSETLSMPLAPPPQSTGLTPHLSVSLFVVLIVTIVVCSPPVIAGAVFFYPNGAEGFLIDI